MPGGQPLRLGPFIGGLNTASDPTAIADAELAVCENFELDIDGSLASRPPLREIAGHTGWTERIVMLCEAVFNGTYYLIGSNINGVYQYTGGVWTLITATIQACAAVQYADKVYLIAKPGSANPSGKWDPSGGFVAVAAIPKGQAAVIHKERLFIAPGVDSTTDSSRLKFSDAGNFDSFPGGNFVDIAQGDGSKLIDVIVFQDNLMCFKNNSTYVFAYDIRPSDAIVREISSTIGVEKQWNVVNYENQVYLFHRGKVYEIINYDFNNINVKVPFIRDTSAPSALAAETMFLSLMEDKLICRFLKKVYVYGLRTRTWTEWKSIRNELQFFGPIVTLRPPTGSEYYAGSVVSAYRSVVQLFDESTNLTLEQTLDPDFEASDTYTRVVANGWGNADNGLVYTTLGGVAADYSVNGTKGLHSLSTLNANRITILPVNKSNIDIKISVEFSAVALTQSFFSSLRARYIDENNYYRVRYEFKTTGVVTAQLLKVVAGVTTTIGAAADMVGTYSANEVINLRLQVNGTSLKAKIWKASTIEPTSWTVTGTDSDLAAAASISFASIAITGVTNPLPVTARYDNLMLGDPTDLTHLITCAARTKNFDMAISHQFKRLWWWGADIISNNEAKGIASPIVVNFSVTWDQLSAYRWDDLLTWDQPLSALSTVETTTAGGSGVVRRFVKFLKSLRYRQINFEIQLTTFGSTADGPVRLFSLTVLTESKQIVPKSVN